MTTMNELLKIEKISTIVSKIAVEDVETTYSGKQGCACGCGGDYYSFEENLDWKLVIATKRLQKINARLKNNPSQVEVDWSYVSIEGINTATRIYLKKHITYQRADDGALIRVEEVK